MMLYKREVVVYRKVMVVGSGDFDSRVFGMWALRKSEVDEALSVGYYLHGLHTSCSVVHYRKYWCL